MSSLAWPVLPAGMATADLEIATGDDRHVQGRRAAMHALERLLGDVTGVSLAYEVTRPVVVGTATPVTISITHGRRRALAVASTYAQLGIDLCDDPDRVARLSDRYLSAESALTITPQLAALCFAIKEAALKALGVGLLDGGVFDDAWPVRVVSLEPPRLDPPELRVLHGRAPEGPFAICYR